MGSVEFNSPNGTCRRCGVSYGRMKGYFPVCYANLYKGAGYMPYCKQCIDDMYLGYMDICKDPKDSVRQMCRKLDLYWNEKLFDMTINHNTNRSVMTAYITKINHTKYSGRSYDDTLKEEGALWSWPEKGKILSEIQEETASEHTENTSENIEIDEEVLSFWGPGYTGEMYDELQRRYDYYKNQLPEDFQFDMSTDALMRQIAMTEIDINRSRAEGRSVDKMANTLNSLISALQKQKAKPSDSDTSNSNTPFGVWIKRWENERPIPEPDPEFSDVDHIVKYISVWFLGHLCKMLGIKNTYCKLYEDEIARLRVERPEYSEEDDETMFNDIFGDKDRSIDNEV